MDKLKTRILLISLILVLLFSVQGISAASNDDGNLTSESIDLSICDNTGSVGSEKQSNNHDDILSSSSELDVLGVDEVPFSELRNEIYSASGNTVVLQHDYYKASGPTDIITIGAGKIIDGNGAVIDMQGSSNPAFKAYQGAIIKNLTIKNAKNDGKGAAIIFLGYGTVENCNFINNYANGFNSLGGAICFNCEMIYGISTVRNCNFTSNRAYMQGGAICFMGTGVVENCNFINNSAFLDGGAIYVANSMKNGLTTITNCSFTANRGGFDGGAVSCYNTTVTYCNFTNNTCSGGGAVYITMGEVTNCNFNNNSATLGGAVYIYELGSVSNSNFANNNASWRGGAVYFYESGSVVNCNFTDNIADNGSAIYFYNDSDVKTVSHSRFLNNRANAESLDVTITNNGIIVIFTGRDNLLNAIYSNGDVSFTDVFYWSESEIANTGSSTPVRSNKEAGQNITVGLVVDDELVLSGVQVTDGKGMIVLDRNVGEKYFMGVRHDTDSYYTEASKTISKNTKFKVNVTSQTTNNRTVNITAKSNIPNEIINGKLLFILPNGAEITANYGGNGTWWAVHTFDDYGVHEVNASYIGLDNVTVNEGTVTINDVRLSVVKSANATEVAYNSTVQFTINITNYGPSDVTEVEVSDWLPKGLTFVEAGVINSTGQYEVFDSLDLLILIGDEEFVTFFEFGSGAAIEDDGDKGDFAQWSITRITGGNSVILLITARANGLVMGNITNEVTVKYHENKTDTIINSTNITVIPVKSSVSVEDVEVTYGDAIVVAVSSENATGVSYKVIGVDGVVKEGTVNVGENITGLDLAAGEYSVNLTTAVLNGNYSSANYTSKITVNPANSSVKAGDVEVTYGDAIVVAVTSENATGVSYKVIGVDGVVKEGAVDVGENITCLDLAAGDYTVNLTTVVNRNYTANSYTSKIGVIPANSSVKAEDVEVTYGDAISIQVSSVNATEISYSIIDGNNKAVVNGTVKVDEAISVSDLAAGNYTVNLTTVVDTNHSSVSNSSKLNIKHVVSIIIVPVTGYAGEIISFTAQFKYENGYMADEGTAGLTIKYDEKEVLAASMHSILGVDQSVPVSNGNATFNVKLNEPGKYPYVVSYSSANTDEFQAQSTLTILKVKTTVSGLDISGKPSDKKDITVTVLDYNKNPVANGTVTLILNGKQYNSTVENGKAILNVELPNPGNYNATVTYNGNDYYNSSTSSIAVDVEKVNTKAPSAEDISGKAGAKTDIKVKIADEYDNPVKNGTATLTIDGKKYTVDVVDGVATFRDVVLPDKDTIADVYYLGNDYYNAGSTTFSIKVKQNNTVPDNNNTDGNKATKYASSKIVGGNATGNPIAMMLLALFAMVITYRKK